MPNRFPSRSLLAVLLLIPLVPYASSGVPLVYNIVQNQSNVSVVNRLNAVVDVEPDTADEFPQIATMNGNSNTAPAPSSTATVDVGLPDAFNDGANGIRFDALEIQFNEIVKLFSLGGISVPLGGGAVQPFAFEADLGSLSIVLDAPFTAALNPTGEGEWLWAGAASMTFSGELSPSIVIPTVQTVELDPVPFAQSMSVLLAGTFSGDGSGTEVTVGIPVGEIQNVPVALPTIQETLDPLELGLVEIDVFFQELVIADLTAAVVYRNPTPIPEPGTAALLGLGLAALAGRRRR